jgi:hypothetical protein
MRKSVTWMLVTITILATLGFSFAVENDYIAVSGQPKLTHTEKINSGDPYTAEVTLTRIGIIPRQATLNISTSAVNPIIKLTIDGEEQTSTTQIVSQELAEEGVSVIDKDIRQCPHCLD